MTARMMRMRSSASWEQKSYTMQLPSWELRQLEMTRPSATEKTMHWIIDPLLMELTMLLPKKLRSVSCSVTVEASASNTASWTSLEFSRPAPGCMTRETKIPTAAAIPEVTTKTRMPLRPLPESCCGVRLPTEVMMVHITNGKMPIWIRRKKIEPTNSICFIAPPKKMPARIAATIAIRICIPLPRPFFLDTAADSAI